MSTNNFVHDACYQDPGIKKYQGNAFIEALPPIMSTAQIKTGLTGKVDFDSKDIFIDANRRIHIIANLLNDFFQPISNHLQLESKISIMIRQGYVGRNPDNGALNSHMQNGYERIQSGDLNSFRFTNVKSTALSMALIGNSGCGKTSTLNRILATYPQAIYHEKTNITQIVYLKLDCPSNGSTKSLCHHFFTAIDKILGTNYETKYALKRHGVETLLTLMSQIANVHAVGVLVIDEIQHLSLSGGIDKMLNFFVTLVNVIGLPVILIGTPKARPIFESDFRSARRGAGFGALFWEPMKNLPSKENPRTGKLSKSEWVAFTDKLWGYQWLQKNDTPLSEGLRECWYDLSQGVLDIVVKLFVLSQLRAIVLKTERLTINILTQVYEDELKPVHPMLDALRSNDPERIVEFSDLCMPDIDKQLLTLSQKIENELNNEDSLDNIYHGNQNAKRLHQLLVAMDCNSDLIKPLVNKAFELHPTMTMQQLMPIILEWYNEPKEKIIKSPTPIIKKQNWNTLPSDDMRFMHSESDNGSYSVYEQLKLKGMIFNSGSWIKDVG